MDGMTQRLRCPEDRAFPKTTLSGLCWFYLGALGSPVETTCFAIPYQYSPQRFDTCFQERSSLYYPNRYKVAYWTCGQIRGESVNRGPWRLQEKAALLKGSCGCFYKSKVFFVDVLPVRGLLFGVYIGAPDFWKLPCI